MSTLDRFRVFGLDRRETPAVAIGLPFESSVAGSVIPTGHLGWKLVKANGELKQQGG